MTDVMLDQTISSLSNDMMVSRNEARNASFREASYSDDPKKMMVSNLGDLEQKHPKVFRMLQEAIFDEIRRENNRYHKRLIERLKEQRRQ